MANPRPIPKAAEEEAHFHQKDAIKVGLQGAMYGGLAGLAISSVQNSLSKQDVGVWGVFTRGNISRMAVLMSVYGFSKSAAANLREKDDTWNTMIGSFLGGASLGLWRGRLSLVLGAGAGFSAVMTTFEYTGGRLTGQRSELPGMDDYETKEYLRKNRRRPIEETIADLGEGRGIFPPGYEERRRQRLKEKYGVEINPVSALAE
ncbi:hypothetical protein F4777DRAFT_579116 [Nemania sp. FL0916]|nr:hypothetical protein F4777DRAFT_579116 [Nemania sp. FL0916]